MNISQLRYRDIFGDTNYVILSFRRYAATIKRQFEVRYDPYTQTIQELGNEVSMQYLHLSLQNEVESLQRAVKELKV